MSGISVDEAEALQRDVQRLLGRCMTRLQQYERQIKLLVAYGALSATADTIGAAQDARVAEWAQQTLGQLVGEFLGSHLANGEPKVVPEDAAHVPDHPATFSFRIRLGLSDADYAQAARDLKELVKLRNGLVHHFIDQQDLGSVDGCRIAQVALMAAYDRIDQSYTLLREWAKDMQQARLQMFEDMQSKEVRDLLVDGIGPDDTVDWPITGIVRVLRVAAGAMAVDSWTSLSDAVAWIAKHHPDENPAKYRRKTWPQVVHESQVFELRYLGEGEERVARYRERPNPSKSETTEKQWTLVGSVHLPGHAPKG